jgi:DNA-3-methyladenine glycosylase II
MEPEAAMEDVQRLPGIGPFYAMLIVVRSTGHSDALAGEGRTLAAIEHFYGLDAPPSDQDLLQIAEPWRPFRTWAGVLLHSAGRRAGLRPAGR